MVPYEGIECARVDTLREFVPTLWEQYSDRINLVFLQVGGNHITRLYLGGSVTFKQYGYVMLLGNFRYIKLMSYICVIFVTKI